MNNLKKSNYTIWCDFIERSFLENQFQDLIKKNIIHGATSNPAIFENSIKNSPLYKEQAQKILGKTSKEIYEILAITDIKRAAEILLPLYQKNSNDGFISLEVDPNFCDDAHATIQEGIRLAEIINMPNIMIKIPATPSGYEAMQHLTAQNIHVNATLIFSSEQAKKCHEALANGIEKSTNKPKAVISVFVSRFDRYSDLLLPMNLQGKLGIINAMQCYNTINASVHKNIRTLFASTGTKGDQYPKSYYIDNLILPNSINTAPLETISAWINEGSITPIIPHSQEQIKEFLQQIAQHKIDLNALSAKLLHDGLLAFKDSFQKILQQINQ